MRTRQPGSFHSAYKGVNIYNAGVNSSGMRYYAHNPESNGPTFLRAETLAGIKQLITNATAKR